MTIQQMRNSTVSICIFLFILTVMTGCEKSGDSTVTDALSGYVPGGLEFVTLSPDSVGISDFYQYDLSEYSSFFAGSLDPVEAFSIFKFSQPGQTVIDDADSVSVYLNVKEVWGDDNPSYELYSIGIDWDEDEPPDADTFLDEIDGLDPVATFTDSTTDISSIFFSIPVDDVDSWDDDGAFLIKGVSGVSSMAYLSSDNSSSLPTLTLYDITDSETDSTTIESEEGIYYFIDGLSDTAPVVANGKATGYILDVNIPELDDNPTPINQSLVRLTLGENLFVDDEMTIMIYRLTEEFTTIEEIETDLSDAIYLYVSADSTTYNVDISEFVDSWANQGETNYGIILKPLSTGTTPDFAVLTPSDSLTIIYTTLPEE